MSIKSIAILDLMTIAALERFVATQWNFAAKPKAFYHNDGNKPMILKMWTPESDFGKEILQTIPLWVKYPNLPLSCWGADSLSRISSVLGTPLFVDECTSKIERISFAQC
ncbi:hypothetical protein KY290_034369 [Solanum tuberosum]|uniref:DUF4283 domain-containing protein n=1 Tax=Solanum tuberosum TaxID=4113 RepID=A0ABQ7U344_SOLTU|nr:hypothetical protein KY284_033472 [Solanum tuberosum]KAH0741326.1 hypothetical protein KY290_034369 [Solanum tuberosum]